MAAGIATLTLNGTTFRAYDYDGTELWLPMHMLVDKTGEPYDATNPIPVDGSGVTQPVSAASLPLPTGAATSAKQPALGTAGTPSADVISVQGHSSMTAIAVSAAASSFADNSIATLGAKADAKSTATDTTSISAMSVWKQVSASVQALVVGTVLAAGSALIGKVGIDQTTDGTTNKVSLGSDKIKNVPVIVTPSATITRPADTTAYTAGDLIASSTTAGSVSYGALTVASSAGSFIITRARLISNHTTGLDQIQLRARLWLGAPTVTNGDNGAFAITTGGTTEIGRFEFTMEQFSDGACGFAVPYIGSEIRRKLASGTDINWTLEAVDGFTPQSGKTFTLELETQQGL
jgi:hypothetical protein